MRRGFGSKVPQPNGTVRIFWYSGGKRRSKTCRDDTEADLELARAQLAQTGGYEDGITWREYHAVKVAPEDARLALKTQSSYAYCWRVLEPIIGRRRVIDTNAARARDALMEIPTTGARLSCYRYMKRMCNMAVRDGLLDRNPVDRGLNLPAHRPARKAVYDVTEIPGLLEDIRGCKFEPLILLELGGGLRVEEACALDWEDIEPWERAGRIYALVHIDKAVVVVDGKPHMKDTKNGFSERDMVIGEPFASRLLELKGKGHVSMGRFGISSPASVTNNWRALCARRGWKYVPPKNLRATFATLHGEALSPDSIVSGAMGHADGTTKGRNYQGITLRGLAKIADNLASFIAEEAAMAQ